MIIYVSTSCLRGVLEKSEKDIFKVLDAYQSLGIRRIELSSCHSPVPDAWELPELLRKKYGLEEPLIHMCFPWDSEHFYLNIAAQNQEKLRKTVEVAKSSIDFGASIGSPLYGIHAGSRVDAGPTSKVRPANEEEAYRTMVATLEDLCSHAQKNSMVVAIENNFVRDCFLRSLDETEKLLRDVNHPNLGLLCDLGHLNLAYQNDREAMAGAIRRNSRYLVGVHFHFNNGESDQHASISDFSLLDLFPREVFESARLILEAHNLSPERIKRAKERLEEEIQNRLL